MSPAEGAAENACLPKAGLSVWSEGETSPVRKNAEMPFLRYSVRLSIEISPRINLLKQLLLDMGWIILFALLQSKRSFAG